MKVLLIGLDSGVSNWVPDNRKGSPAHHAQCFACRENPEAGQYCSCQKNDIPLERIYYFTADDNNN
jgi:hypothetical protein